MRRQVITLCDSRLSFKKEIKKNKENEGGLTLVVATSRCILLAEAGQPGGAGLARWWKSVDQSDRAIHSHSDPRAFTISRAPAARTRLSNTKYENCLLRPS